MEFNRDWIYRELYNYHILVNSHTNQIIQISSLLSELFAVQGEDATQQIDIWALNHNISEEKKYELISHLCSKGVLIDGEI